LLATAKANQTEEASSEASLGDKSALDDGLRGRLSDGKRCASVIDEMKRIKRMCDLDGMTITQIEERHKDFEVWAIVKNRLDAEEQEIFRHPRRWASTVGYALLLLTKEHERAKSTIYDWVKDYRRYSKAKR
jgi:hypothetical protein